MNIQVELQRAIEKNLRPDDTLNILTAIKNGVVSNVYFAKLNNSDVVIKLTGDFAPVYPTPLFISRKMHHVDVRVLCLLKGSEVRVPEVLRDHADDHIVIMENLAVLGYQPISNLIAAKQFNCVSGTTIGHALAALISASERWSRFDTAESAASSLEQRGLELRVAYPNTPGKYAQIEAHFLSGDKWVWADAHPKNILINEDGDCALIDFGESFFGDNRYMLANYIAHIFIYGVSGYIARSASEAHIIDCLNAYREKHMIDERIFCQYLAMEVLHRAFGRWIDGITDAREKIRLVQAGLALYEQATAIDEVLNILKTSI